MISANDVEKRPKKPRGKPKLIRRRPRHSTLRISPYAWAKLLYLRDAGATEIGGFGISGGDDLLLIEDVRLVRQQADVASVAFEDAAVADFFDEQVELGRQPEQFGRVWVHTHPGSSAEPSGVDDETFARVFGRCEWAVMLIVASGGASYARLQVNAGPGLEKVIPVEMCYHTPFAATDEQAWQGEYERCVSLIAPAPADAGDLVAPAWRDVGYFSDAYRYDDYYRDLEGAYDQVP